MPLYEFRCPKCKVIREEIRPFGVDPSLCPQCQKRMEKLISSPAIIRAENIPLKYKKLGITPFKSWEPGPSEA